MSGKDRLKDLKLPVRSVEPVGASGGAEVTSAFSRLPRRKPAEPPVRVPTSLTSLSAERSGAERAGATSLTSLSAERSGVEVRCALCQDKHYLLYAQNGYCRAKLCRCRPVCETCGDRGYWLERQSEGYLVHKPCDCRALPRRLETFNQALIPMHYLNKDLGNMEVGQHESLKPVLQAVTAYGKYYPEERNGMVLVGEPGMGKTHLMVGLLKVLTLEKGVSCLFKDFFLLLSEVREAWQKDRGDAEVIRPLTEVEVLVIDELGKGRSNSDWEQAVLDEIICKRYNQLKTTFFTTNFPTEPGREDSRAEEGLPAGVTSFRGRNLSDPRFQETLEQRVGERIFSRLCHMCNFYQLGGTDYRRIHKASAHRS